jgi:tetratricopeptide (TPR) repeat protein
VLDPGDGSDRRSRELSTLVRAYVLGRRKQWDRAGALLAESACTCEPAMRPVFYYWQGRAAYEREDFEASAAALARVPMLYDVPPALRADAWWRAAQAFEARRQTDRALEIYKELSQNFGQLRPAQQARQRASELTSHVPRPAP